MAANLSTLFWDGIVINNTRYYFALIGVKGDAEFHVECADLLRSYMTVGTANNLLMCPECDADDNFGDVSDHPAWLPTVASRIHLILLYFWKWFQIEIRYSFVFYYYVNTSHWMHFAVVLRWGNQFHGIQIIHRHWLQSRSQLMVSTRLFFTRGICFML